MQAIESIPASHRQHWPLWLDHFDTAWLTFTHAIPAATAFGTKPEVSLYDHSKTTAALAVALWRWHEAEGRTDAPATAQLKDRTDWDTEKFLLVQGDFFGIQDFIFADGSKTRRDAARLLRGRSFQVSLFTELAALKVLDALELPPTSQITNAAGKFLIVAPNTAGARVALQQVHEELNAWFLQHSFGLAGLGLAAKPASCNDFLEKKPEHRFQALMTALFADLEKAKLHRFDLAGNSPSVFDVAYPQGVCAYNDRLPADQLDGEGNPSAALSRDQIAIGKGLSRQDRLLLLRQDDRVVGFSTLQRREQAGFVVYFSGDTGLFTAMQDIGEKLGPFDVTMIEVGQYHRGWPDWHIGPEQALTAHQMLRGKVFFPIHWGLLTLAYHAWTEPVERAVAAALHGHQSISSATLPMVSFFSNSACASAMPDSGNVASIDSVGRNSSTAL